MWFLQNFQGPSPWPPTKVPDRFLCSFRTTGISFCGAKPRDGGRCSGRGWAGGAERESRVQRGQPEPRRERAAGWAGVWRPAGHRAEESQGQDPRFWPLQEPAGRVGGMAPEGSQGKGGKQGKRGPPRAPRGSPLRAPPTVGLASPRWGRQLCQEGLPVPSAPQTRRQELNNWKHVPGAVFLHVPLPPHTCSLGPEMLPLPGSLLATGAWLTVSLPGASDPSLSSKGTKVADLRLPPLPGKMWTSHSCLSSASPGPPVLSHLNRWAPMRGRKGMSTVQAQVPGLHHAVLAPKMMTGHLGHGWSSDPIRD